MIIPNKLLYITCTEAGMLHQRLQTSHPFYRLKAGLSTINEGHNKEWLFTERY